MGTKPGRKSLQWGVNVTSPCDLHWADEAVWGPRYDVGPLKNSLYSLIRGLNANAAKGTNNRADHVYLRGDPRVLLHHGVRVHC